MGKIIAIANQKGGVGKTTTSVNLSACIAQLGRRVLLVDLDPQGNTTTALGLDKAAVDHSVYDVLVNHVSIKNVIRSTMVDELSLLPSKMELAGAEIELVQIDTREKTLAQVLEPAVNDYEYIIIDCPPSLGMLTLNALAAADSVLITIQSEFFALEGLSQLLETVSRVRNASNPDLDISGIVLTMYDARTNLAAQVKNEIETHFPEVAYSTVIPRNIRLSEAPGYGLPITLYDPSCQGAIAYMELAREFLRREEQ